MGYFVVMEEKCSVVGLGNMSHVNKKCIVICR